MWERDVEEEVVEKEEEEEEVWRAWVSRRVRMV